MVRPLSLLAAALMAAGPSPVADRTLPVDPVELLGGREVPGDTALAVTHGRYTYIFATPRTRAAFEADPSRYEIQLGGACARMGPLSGQGNPGLFAAMGGAAAIDGITTCTQRVEEKVVSGEKTYQVVRSIWIEFPARFARETRWDKDGWGEVVDAGVAFLFGSAESRDMVASQRRAFEKELGRDPLLILRGRDALGTLVSHTGSAEIDGRAVELVAVACAGRTSTLAIDAQTGAILAVSYRGRGPSALFGAREDRYSDFRPVGTLTLPFHRSVLFNGEPADRLSETLASLEIDGAIDPAVFRRRRP